ncbi:MAG TPA: hypothetical protein VF708_00440 [Pyrinomonadaceae bacterium]|jgi:hypothetical protein
MAEEDEDDWGRPRPLKKAGSKKLEDAIAKAASEVAGEEYCADIKSVDFEPDTYASMFDACEIKVRLSRKKNNTFRDNER